MMRKLITEVVCEVEGLGGRGRQIQWSRIGGNLPDGIVADKGTLRCKTPGPQDLGSPPPPGLRVCPRMEAACTGARLRRGPRCGTRTSFSTLVGLELTKHGGGTNSQHATTLAIMSNSHHLSW